VRQCPRVKIKGAIIYTLCDTVMDTKKNTYDTSIVRKINVSCKKKTNRTRGHQLTCSCFRCGKPVHTESNLSNEAGIFSGRRETLTPRPTSRYECPRLGDSRTSLNALPTTVTLAVGPVIPRLRPTAVKATTSMRAAATKRFDRRQRRVSMRHMI
jgi:hypothetical protein